MHFKTLAHSKWYCKYHVVFIPKYRRKELYGVKQQIVVDMIKKWAKIKEVDILEGCTSRKLKMPYFWS